MPVRGPLRPCGPPRKLLRFRRFSCILVPVTQVDGDNLLGRKSVATMEPFEEVTRDMREFAIEVKKLGYLMPAGYENRFLELSERMIKRTDDLTRSPH